MASAMMFEKGCHGLESLSGYPVLAAFSDRCFNLRFEEDLSDLQNDRRLFSQMAGFPLENLVCMEQIHGANIVLVDGEMKGKGALTRASALPKADGVITRERGIPIGAMTADCGSVFFYDPKKQAIGIAHVGWRGLFNKLPQKMIAAFSGNFLSRSEDLCIAFGPMIRKCCYEVGQDVAAYFPGHVQGRLGKFYLDLPSAIQAALEETGVRKAGIEDPGFCTFCESSRFFSYRREGQSAGRMMSVIMLR